MSGDYHHQKIDIVIPKKSALYRRIAARAKADGVPVDAVPADQIQVHFSKVYLLAGECVLEVAICGKPTVVRIPCSQNVVEVVRCKGCKYWRHSEKNIVGPEYGTCVECLMDTKADFFCGFGERWPE